jgi:hypothetical protein
MPSILKKVILCDIDGTLANLEHRKQYATSTPKNWSAFYATVSQDTPILQTVWLVQQLHQLQGAVIVFCSGRHDGVREETKTWLETHLGFAVEHLYMRRYGDHRSDHVVKAALLETIRQDGFEPFLVLDDRPEVVAMWRRNGLFVLDCNQSDEVF